MFGYLCVGVYMHSLVGCLVGLVTWLVGFNYRLDGWCFGWLINQLDGLLVA